jgi:hypothetical protein
MTNLRTARAPIVFPLSAPHRSLEYLWQGRMRVVSGAAIS